MCYGMNCPFEDFNGECRRGRNPCPAHDDPEPEHEDAAPEDDEE